MEMPWSWRRLSSLSCTRCCDECVSTHPAWGTWSWDLLCSRSKRSECHSGNEVWSHLMLSPILTQHTVFIITLTSCFGCCLKIHIRAIRILPSKRMLHNLCHRPTMIHYTSWIIERGRDFTELREVSPDCKFFPMQFQQLVIPNKIIQRPKLLKSTKTCLWIPMNISDTLWRECTLPEIDPCGAPVSLVEHRPVSFDSVRRFHKVQIRGEQSVIWWAGRTWGAGWTSWQDHERKQLWSKWGRA